MSFEPQENASKTPEPKKQNLSSIQRIIQQLGIQPGRNTSTNEVAQEIAKKFEIPTTHVNYSSSCPYGDYIDVFGHADEVNLRYPSNK